MNAKYVLDANVLIYLNRHQPIDVYPSVWMKLGELFRGGVLISSHEVFEEIAIGKDGLFEWIKDFEDSFLPSDENIQMCVRGILQTHRMLVEGGRKNNNADPFIIAVAKEMNCTVVTDESMSGEQQPPKVPNVCADLHIKCINTIQFMRETGMVF